MVCGECRIVQRSVGMHPPTTANRMNDSVSVWVPLTFTLECMYIEQLTTNSSRICFWCSMYENVIERQRVDEHHLYVASLDVWYAREIFYQLVQFHSTSLFDIYTFKWMKCLHIHTGNTTSLTAFAEVAHLCTHSSLLLPLLTKDIWRQSRLTLEYRDECLQ